MSDPLASSPAHYVGTSYKPIVEKWLKANKKQEQPEAEKDDWKKFKLSDGALLTITTRGKQINYVLKLTDGRRVVLDKTETTMSLLVTDKNDKTIKTLGCEL